MTDDAYSPRQYRYKGPTVRISVNLFPSVQAELKVIAKEKDVTVAYLSSYLLQEGLAAYKKENKS